MTDLPPGKEAELVELVRSIDVAAPESLHRSVRSLVDGRTSAHGAQPSRAARERPSGWRSPLGPRIAAAGALAAVVVAALIVGLSSTGTSTLTVRQASALTLERATAAAPVENPRESSTLTAAVEGVSFPYWEDRFGWRSTGTRIDRLGGRSIQTVYYTERGRRIGYAIVGGSGAPKVSGGTVAMRGGRPYNMSVIDGRPVITWLRDGHLCVISGSGVDSATLLRLASWTDGDTLS